MAKTRLHEHNSWNQALEQPQNYSVNLGKGLNPHLSIHAGIVQGGRYNPDGGLSWGEPPNRPRLNIEWCSKYSRDVASTQSLCWTRALSINPQHGPLGIHMSSEMLQCLLQGPTHAVDSAIIKDTGKIYMYF
jgi:hypothetical protein